MITIGILAVLAFVASIIFDRPAKGSKTKVRDKFILALEASGKVILWGLFLIVAIILFVLLCKFRFFGSL